MAARKPEVPAITGGTLDDVIKAVNALRQRALIEDGVNADVADKKPTVQDLIDAGVTNAELIK